MSASEYLAFLPLLIYGIALSDLFRQWNRFLDLKKIFLPYLLLTVILTETALYNVFLFAGLLEKLEGLTYTDYLIYLAPPFLFLLATIFFTPDDDSETEVYFMKNMPVFLTLFALFSASHLLYDFNEKTTFLLIRIIGIIIILLTGILRKKWMVYLLGALWILSMFTKGGVIST
ncbi:MAG: hypothetical protein QNK35_05960 [Bacteroides sp.]|nr:hypothetical protein [Bacteroides sp.]